MVLPTTQDIRAKLSPKVKGTDYEGKLENLKSSLNLAYKMVHRNIRKSNETNRQYYDRKAKKRSFKVNDWVYLFNPARKRGDCSKFKFLWSGPFKIIAKLSDLDYRIAKRQGKEFTVNVNRLKRAYNKDKWETQGKESVRKTLSRRQPVQEEDEEELRSSGPITVPVPRVERRQPTAQTPNRNSPRRLDNPAAPQTVEETPRSERTDPNYDPPDTPRSRREMETARTEPPLTRLRSRL